MAVLQHTPIGISIPYQRSSCLAIGEPKVTHSHKVPEDTLYSVPVCHAGVRLATVNTANAMSGRVASATQLSAPTALR